MGDDMDEVVTRGILKEELAKELERRDYVTTKELDRRDYVTTTELDRRDYATKRDLEIWAGAIIAKVTTQIREDLQSAVGLVVAQFERSMRLALEPTSTLPERVAAIEGADLPGRVNRLEAKVFRPRRTPRRGRG